MPVPDDDTAHIKARFSQAALQTVPFPHLVVRDVLPEAVYRGMENDTPPAYLWALSAATMTLTQNVPRGIPQVFQPFFSMRKGTPDLTTALLSGYSRRWIERYQAHIDLIDKLTREAFAPALRTYEAWLKARGLCEALSPAEGSSFFCQRTAEWNIAPHTHGLAQLIQSMIYMPLPGSAQDQGTVLWKLKRPVDDDLSAFMGTRHFADDDIERVLTLPYERNVLVSFLNTPYSIHSSPDVRGPARRYVFTQSISASPFSSNAHTLRLAPTDRLAA
jgi:hypothetical protein